jgi:hypothetical protein
MMEQPDPSSAEAENGAEKMLPPDSSPQFQSSEKRLSLEPQMSSGSPTRRLSNLRESPTHRVITVAARKSDGFPAPDESEDPPFAR